MVDAMGLLCRPCPGMNWLVPRKESYNRGRKDCECLTSRSWAFGLELDWPCPSVFLPPRVLPTRSRSHSPHQVLSLILTLTLSLPPTKSCHCHSHGSALSAPRRIACVMSCSRCGEKFVPRALSASSVYSYDVHEASPPQADWRFPAKTQAGDKRNR
jgi:hypothetical protein